MGCTSTWGRPATARESEPLPGSALQDPMCAFDGTLGRQSCQSTAGRALLAGQCWQGSPGRAVLAGQSRQGSPVRALLSEHCWQGSPGRALLARQSWQSTAGTAVLAVQCSHAPTCVNRHDGMRRTCCWHVLVTQCHLWYRQQKQGHFLSCCMLLLLQVCRNGGWGDAIAAAGAAHAVWRSAAAA
jgi:hypothetical protein